MYYLGHQLGLSPSLALEVPDRKATATWLQQHARPGLLPETLFQQAEHYLLEQRILLPGPSVLEWLIVSIVPQTSSSSPTRNAMR